MCKRMRAPGAFFLSLLFAALGLAPGAVRAQDQAAEEESEMMTNPYAGQAEAATEGKALYDKFSCYACHGRDGSGAMGPSLLGEPWRYGGEDHDLFVSVKSGRPEGMPSFGGALKDDQIWKIVTFIQSLSAEESAGSDSP